MKYKCLKNRNKFKMAKTKSRHLFCCKTGKYIKPLTEEQIKELALKQQQLDEELAKKKEKEELENAGQEVAKQTSKKKKIRNALLFALNIVVVVIILVYQLKTAEVTPFKDLIARGLSWGFVPLILVSFAIVMLLDTLRSNLFIIKDKNRSRPSLSYKSCAICKYYDAITPLSTGGQPFQVFYYNKRGLKTSTAISVPVARYVFSQIAWIIVSFIAVFLLLKLKLADASVISIASYIGFALNFLVLSFTLVLSLSKKLGKKLVVKSLKFLHKIKIVKNYEKQYDRVMKVISGYQGTMSAYAKDVIFFLVQTVISILIFLINFSIPFFIYCFLGGTDIAMWPVTLILSIMIELAAGFIPLPGGTGMNEISFTVVFTGIFPAGTVFWGLLLWRFMSYYLYLIQGILVMVYDYSIGNRRYEWLKRKWELEAESVVFKEQQIKNYKNRIKKNKNKF